MAETTITVGSPGHLVLASQPTRGVTYEASSNWDYVLFSNSADSPGCPVIFRERGDGYTIEMTAANWGSYIYWTFGMNDSIYLVRDQASVWHVAPVENGFRIASGSSTVTYSPAASKRWLYATEDISGTSHQYVTFQFSKA